MLGDDSPTPEYSDVFGFADNIKGICCQWEYGSLTPECQQTTNNASLVREIDQVLSKVPKIMYTYVFDWLDGGCTFVWLVVAT